jgi:gliding motility-associated-like protein
MSMKKISLFLFVFLLTTAAFSQTYLISSQGTVTACSGDFFDSGNSSAAYGNNETYTMTIHAPSAPNTHIKMIWNMFDVEPGDTLIIYDGSTTAAPVIGRYNNNNPPSSFTQASVYNATGDLTFKFKSNGSVTAAGWWGGFLCGQPCQTVMALLDTVNTAPQPNDSNYIDICIGQPITFAALTSGAAFPQNDALYHQDASTTNYSWDFGDGTTATGATVTHTYTEVRGYDVILTVTDTRGCMNANALGLRVRISGNPYGEIHPIADICSSLDTTYITLGYDVSSIITIHPVTSIQSSSQRFDSTMFIPDGPSCPPGCYNTDVTFNVFAPGATITSAADVLSVVVSIEHSFAGDLGFTLHCPNGQTVVLDGNDHSGGSYLGNANDTDGSNICDPTSNLPGSPWIYGWSTIYPQQGSLNTLDAGASPVPATDTLAHTGYLTPDQSFAGLIGCPLNGTWSIEICDNWGIDNGYIFMWELNLDPSLLPQGWSYDVPIEDVLWSGEFFSIINDTTIMVVPDSGGTFQYTVTLVDAFGCTYDTTLNIQVVNTPKVDLGNDTVICGNGIIYNLDAGPGTTYIWSTSAPTETIPVTSTGLYTVTVENYNATNTLTCADADSIYVKVLALPAVDLGPDICVNAPVTLDAGNPGFNYIWSTGAADTNQTITVSQAGTYTVTVAQEFGYNCQIVDDIVVGYFPIPTISIGPDSTICRHHSITINPIDQNGFLDDYNYSYYWHDPFYNNTRYISLSWLTPGTYSVIVDVTGCPGQTVSDTLQLVVEPCDLTIPNVITPNGDGQNETFNIPNVLYYPNSTMIIYNRWGRKVYESSNYQGDWNGENCADGVYFWVFTINYGDNGNGEETKQMNGTLTILR